MAADGTLDATTLWSVVQTQVGDDPSYRWLHDLEMVSFAGDQVELRLLGAARARASYIQTKDKELARRFSEAAGRSIRVKIHPPAPRGGRDGGSRSSEEAAPSRRRGLSDAERDAAMRLPLVSRIIEQFNASIVDIRDEAAPLTPPASDEDDSAESA